MKVLFGLLVFATITAAVLAVSGRSVARAVGALAASLLGCAALAAFLSPGAAAAQLLPSAVVAAVLSGGLLVTAQRGLSAEGREQPWISLPGLAVAGALFVVQGLWTARQAAWAAFAPQVEGAASPPGAGLAVVTAFIAAGLALAACLGARLLVRPERSS